MNYGVTLLMFASIASPESYPNFINKDNFEVINYGLYSSKVIERVNHPSSPTGKISMLSEFKHLKTTTNIPSVINTKFGVEYKINTNRYSSVRLNIRWIPSALGKSIPNNKIKTTSYFVDKKTNIAQYAGYRLSIDKELQAESWILQIYLKNTLLHERVFNLNGDENE